jgi:nucleoside-diphosphate-sugar epimerase
MTATVLLTGASGFVGYQVLSSLVARQVPVRVVLREGSQDQLSDYVTEKQTIMTADLFSETADWWEQACSGVDTVIHVAWYTVPGEYLQAPENLDCLIGSLNLAKAAAQAGVRRFVGIGTCFEYDLSEGELSVDTSLKPLTPYAAAKAALYTALSQWLPARQVEFLWCRLFYLYGEREDPRRLVPYLREQLMHGKPAELTSGNQVRDFIDVAVAGQMIAEEALGSRKGAINICSGIPITVRQFAEQIADEYSRRDLLKFGARPDNLIDPPCVVGIK